MNVQTVSLWNLSGVANRGMARLPPEPGALTAAQQVTSTRVESTWEEVDREHAGGLDAQELPPVGVGVSQRRRWDAVALQDPPDRRGADAVAELEQLTLDPRVSPARVLPRHPHHQGGEDVVDRWPSGPVRVGPSSADEAAMPAQDRVRGDQALATQCAGQPPRRARRRWPGPPSPCVVVGWCGAGWRPRGAARGARCPWRRTCGPAVGPARAPAGRSSTAAAATRRDHVRPAITAGQRPRPDFWHPTRGGRRRAPCRRLLRYWLRAARYFREKLIHC